MLRPALPGGGVMTDLTGFKTIEHTADIGIRAWGRTTAELFENAASGMFNIICDTATVEPAESYAVEVEAEDLETLLVEWLNELLYLSESGELLFSSFKVLSMGETVIKGSAFGEPLDRDRHKLGTEIKAVTYHMLKVEQEDDMWVGTVIFDV